jgi:hypothetical protein
LSRHGDHGLRNLSDRICARLFSSSFAYSIGDDWNGSENWRSVSAAYQINRYVGWVPSDLGKATFKESKKERFWGDIWDGWWGSLFRERELWLENVEDMESFLRHLIHLKYADLIELYSTRYLVDHSETEVKESLNSSITVQPIQSDEGPLAKDVMNVMKANKLAQPIAFLATTNLPPTTTAAKCIPLSTVCGATEDDARFLARAAANGSKSTYFLSFLSDDASKTKASC